DGHKLANSNDFAIRMKKFYKKTGRRVRIDGNKPVGFDKKKLECFKSSTSAQNVAFVSHSKSSNNKVKSGHTEDLDLLHKDLEQIDDMDIKEMDINWQITMIAIRMKKFYKKTGRRVRIDGNKPVGFDKKKLECFKCHSTGHFARECPSKGTNDEKKRDSFYQDQGAGKKEQNQNCLLTMDDGLTFQANEIYAKDEKLKKYRRLGMKAVKEKEQLQKTVDSWKNSSKNLWKLVDSGMTSNSKIGLGYEIQSNNEVLSYEEEMNRIVFKCTEEDFLNKPLYNRFSKTDNFKGVPHPLTGETILLNHKRTLVTQMTIPLSILPVNQMTVKDLLEIPLSTLLSLNQKVYAYLMRCLRLSQLLLMKKLYLNQKKLNLVVKHT
ncbi:ribonuclease H-like domain-containing protein, partial [Tanacetum coccineum]